MPRIRTIKPDFFISETVSALQFRTRLTWIGLWTHCDDYGRHRDNVKLIKAAVWPLDAVSLRDVTEDLDELIAAGLLYRYAVDGRTYLQVTNWDEHQKVDRPSKSTIPAPTEGSIVEPGQADVPAGQDTRETLASPREPASSPRDRKGKEGKGKEGTRASAREAPPAQCPEHLEDPDPPACGRCASARKARERWDREQVATASAAQQARARDHAATARAAIDACKLCDDQGYRGTQVCSHDPTQADRARNGAAAARAVAGAARPPRQGHR
ncbi:hypothetical protein ABZS66_19125 [Dactylosporangium sp. NPDC005572]|uniref:hypothetical protein n=1 Tax=Dactylosporangium sp. NPDC005572 TaxID=3156889 RepID=UPI0033B94558